MRSTTLAGWALLTLVSCSKPPAPITSAPAPVGSTPATALPSATASSGTARRVMPEEIAGDQKCGPFKSSELQPAEQPMLADRVRVRFFAGATPAGAEESFKIEVQRGDATLFVGARETFDRGDEQFEAKATKAATFRGTYDPIAIRGKTPDVAIIAGLVHEIPNDGEMVAIAHGWFLDPSRNVIDVAVFASKSAIADLPACHRFAEKLLGTVSQGGRTLTQGGAAETDTKVSYASFHYRLPAEWSLTSSFGIHDFARMHFRKRGVFPDQPTTELQLALDSHPGDWASEGAETGQRAAQLLGLPVSWHLTSGEGSFGAWTVSKDVINRDHAVASIRSGSAQDRDEAMRFAESIRVTR